MTRVPAIRAREVTWKLPAAALRRVGDVLSKVKSFDFSEKSSTATCVERHGRAGSNCLVYIRSRVKPGYQGSALAAIAKNHDIPCRIQAAADGNDLAGVVRTL